MGIIWLTFYFTDTSYSPLIMCNITYMTNYYKIASMANVWLKLHCFPHSLGESDITGQSTYRSQPEFRFEFGNIYLSIEEFEELSSLFVSVTALVLVAVQCTVLLHTTAC